MPPVIDGEEVEDKTVVLGQSTTFTCKVTGVPKPFVIWLKDEAVITDIVRHHEAKESKYKLS